MLNRLYLGSPGRITAPFAENKTLQRGIHALPAICLGSLTAILTLGHQGFAIISMAILIFWYVLKSRFQLSLYVLVFLAIIFLEFASLRQGGMGGRSYQFYLSFLVMMFFACEVLAKRLRFHIPVNDKVNLLILAFFFFNLLSMSFSIDPYKSARNVTMVLQIPFYFICAEIFYTRGNSRRHFAYGMTGLGIFVAGFVLLNYFVYGASFGYFRSPKESFIMFPFLFHNVNTMAYALIVCLQFPLYMLTGTDNKHLKRFLSFLLFIMSAGILATYSRTGVALLLFSYVIFAFKHGISRKVLAYTLIACFMTLVSLDHFWGSAWYENYFLRFTAENTIGQFHKHRGATWKVAFEEFMNRPFLGVGQDTLIWELHEEYSLTHNTYVNILAERGVFTFLSYILILLYFLRLSMRLTSKSRSDHPWILEALTGVLMVHYISSLTGDYADSKFLWLIFSMLTAEKMKWLRNRHSVAQLNRIIYEN